MAVGGKETIDIHQPGSGGKRDEGKQKGRKRTKWRSKNKIAISPDRIAVVYRPRLDANASWGDGKTSGVDRVGG